jgi:O-acetyl-ADP-ribose deacetylase (regulator of RNase III)
MITFTQGDILKANAEALVNTVNCVGVMGRGVALQFRKAFPDNFKAYEAACKSHEVRPGKMFVYDLNSLCGVRFIINFPTKEHWKGKSRITDVQSGLADLADIVKRRRIRSIAIPPLGCGLGGLNWDEVRPLLIETFQSMPEITVLVFEPAGAPQAAEMVKVSEPPNMTVGRAALLGLMRRYLTAVMDPFITLLEVHKLMYFMQEAGEPLRLSYQKAPYGPYAKNLRHVLSSIEGHFISGYGDAEDRPDKPLELKLDAVERAEALLAKHKDTKERFDRVADIIKGFETTSGMELLSTVHWVAVHEGAATVEAAVANIHAWSNRKRMFKPEHIRLAWDRLCATQWLRSGIALID